MDKTLIAYESYANEINTDLCNDFIAFVMESAKSSLTDFRKAVKEKCIWYSCSDTNVREKYNGCIIFNPY